MLARSGCSAMAKWRRAGARSEGVGSFPIDISRKAAFQRQLSDRTAMLKETVRAQRSFISVGPASQRFSMARAGDGAYPLSTRYGGRQRERMRAPTRRAAGLAARGSPQILIRASEPSETRRTPHDVRTIARPSAPESAPTTASIPGAAHHVV